MWLRTSALFHTALIGGVLTGLYPHSCNTYISVVSEFDHWTHGLGTSSSITGQYHDTALATG